VLPRWVIVFIVPPDTTNITCRNHPVSGILSGHRVEHGQRRIDTQFTVCYAAGYGKAHSKLRPTSGNKSSVSTLPGAASVPRIQRFWGLNKTSTPRLSAFVPVESVKLLCIRDVPVRDPAVWIKEKLLLQLHRMLTAVHLARYASRTAMPGLTTR
jgi:hypothetical protein